MSRGLSWLLEHFGIVTLAERSELQLALDSDVARRSMSSLFRYQNAEKSIVISHLLSLSLLFLCYLLFSLFMCLISDAPCF